MKKLIGTLLPLFLIIAAPVFSQDNEAIIRKTEEYAKKVQDQWQIPGMAISVVKDGKMIYSNGFGVKELGKDEKIDANTLFQIGSVSKSFTAAVMASLVEEGKVKWEDTVKNIL
ncbi:MAG: serine hydrolase domain-containing protein, partial [Bacteroidales bacterium]|nr:serine hydrolase domain-containing protein [Bacteroidales bacterium]